MTSEISPQDNNPNLFIGCSVANQL